MSNLTSNTSAYTVNPRDNMTTSLARGEAGAIEFYEKWKTKYPNVPIEKLEGTKADFYLLVSGDSIELKTDFKDSQNFYMEHIRNVDTGAPGGPWQSKEKGITFYAYRCVAENRTYYFRVEELCQRLEELDRTVGLPTSSVPSHDDKGNEWENRGYIVNKGMLEDLIWVSTGNPEEPLMYKP